MQLQSITYRCQSIQSVLIAIRITIHITLAFARYTHLIVGVQCLLDSAQARHSGVIMPSIKEYCSVTIIGILKSKGLDYSNKLCMYLVKNNIEGISIQHPLQLITYQKSRPSVLFQNSRCFSSSSNIALHLCCYTVTLEVAWIYHSYQRSYLIGPVKGFSRLLSNFY